MGPACPILAITDNEKTFNQLGLVWNVTPVLVTGKSSIDETVEAGIEEFKKADILEKGDIVVISGGAKILNNNSENLEWCTHRENSLHSVRVLGNKPNVPIGKSVKCVETGIVYPSIEECARMTKSISKHISACCNKRRKTHNGFHWEFLNDAQNRNDGP